MKVEEHLRNINMTRQALGIPLLKQLSTQQLLYCSDWQPNRSW